MGEIGYRYDQGIFGNMNRSEFLLTNPTVRKVPPHTYLAMAWEIQIMAFFPGQCQSKRQ